MATEPEHIRVTYNEVHNIIKKSTEQISEFKPDLVIAIGREILISYALHLFHNSIVVAGGGLVRNIALCSSPRLVFSCAAASFLRVFWFVDPILILSCLWGANECRSGLS